MDLSNLRPAEGSVKARKRIGRGTGSGRGGTSTRGHKGDKARSGSKEKRHFEGGQTPMQRRLPKRGFKNVNREVYAALNLGQLELLSQKLGKDQVAG
jgi:large subunit ribosomal protein L15